VKLDHFFRVWPELARLCSQNGWIDSQSLRVEVVEHEGDRLIVALAFEEIVSEGAARVPCFGQACVEVGDNGEVARAWLI